MTTNLKQYERQWQDDCGAAQQQSAYDRPGMRMILHAQFARIADAVRLRPGIRLLELGCGVGHLLGWLGSHTTGEYHGVDLSVKSLDVARQASPWLQVAVGDAESLPYKSLSVDRIVCNGSVHHFLDKRAAVREIHRVLAPGGMLVMYEPVKTPLTRAVRALLLSGGEHESPSCARGRLTTREMTALLAEAGFAGISVSLHDFLAYPLSGNYVGSPLTRSRRFMELLWAWERRLARCSVLKHVCDLFAWRSLIVAIKPGLGHAPSWREPSETASLPSS